MARTVDLGVTQWLWLEGEDAIANELAPTAAELTVGSGIVNISSQVVTTTDLGNQASDTVNERSVTDVANVVVPTVGNYGGNLVMFRDFTTGAPTANDPLTIIGNEVGAVGWLAKRVGLPSSTAAAASQKYSLWLVMIDTPQTSGGQGDGYLKATFPLLQQGRFAIEVAVVA